MIKRWFVTLVSVVVLSGPLSAGELVATPAQHLILPPAKPVVVDGKLEEWKIADSPIVISATTKAPLGMVSATPAYPVKSDADLSGQVALAWDREYLYVAGRMVDDHLVGLPAGLAHNLGGPPWSYDSLMVVVASFRQPMTPNSPWHRTPFLGLRYSPPGPDARGEARKVDTSRAGWWVLPEGSRLAVAETLGGYNVEAAIPWAGLGFDARPGERLFIGFLAADVDPGENLKQVGWGYSEDPRQRPLFRLADREDLMGILTVSADEVALDRPWSVRAELDVFAGEGRLDALRVVDRAGKVVAERPVGLAVPAGSTGVRLESFRAGEVAAVGDYDIVLMAAAPGAPAAAVARVPLRVVEPAPEPPIIQNPPGAIHHMPPDRVVLNAAYRHQHKYLKHHWINSREDLGEELLRRVTPQRLKDDTKGRIAGKNTWGRFNPFSCLALYRLTGDEEFIQLGRDTMDYLMDMQFVTHRNDRWISEWFWLIVAYRHLTWQQDPNSPWAPPNAEQRYREGLHKIAAGDGSANIFDEAGTHNRIWHRYTQLKIARHVAEQDGKPVDPRVVKYTDYHDRVLGQVGDVDDASSHYIWVGIGAQLALYFHTGDWSLLNREGFQRQLLRKAEHIAPSGALPTFGDGHGWPAVGDDLWVLEMMSTQTKDGRYRWSFHRVVEYLLNHSQPMTYHMPAGQFSRNLVFAYLFADDAVEPAAPRADSRLTWSHPMLPTPREEMDTMPGLWHHRMDAAQWVPDKLVLASGREPTDLWGLLELASLGGHRGETAGSLITLMQHDSALLAGQGYGQYSPEYYNMMWIEDLDGLAYDSRPIQVDIPDFLETPSYTYARLVISPYQHLPATCTRDVFFFKQGFVVLKDRVRFEAPFKARVGPCIQTRSLGPECGDHWFNTYYDQLIYSGMGRGGGVQAMRNPAWDLLVYFAPRSDRKQTVDDRTAANPYNSPIQLRQVWAGMAQAGQELTFTTVLLPHRPSFKPSEFAADIEVVRDDDEVTVLKVTHETDINSRFRRPVWLMLNETGATVKAGPLESDARLAVVQLTDAKAGVGHSLRAASLANGSVLRFEDADCKPAIHTLAPVALPAELR